MNRRYPFFLVILILLLAAITIWLLPVSDTGGGPVQKPTIRTETPTSTAAAGWWSTPMMVPTPTATPTPGNTP